MNAQRPNATAVLELEKWNKQFGRWVNKGATGIAVFDDEHNGNNQLKYYFDISDTHESRMSRPVPIWNVQEQYEDDIIETLESTFGTLEYRDDLPTALIYAATNAVEDNFSDYLSELMYCREDSFLEELDELNVEKYFKEALECSVSYMLLERCCGGAADDYRKLVDFSSVINFNTRETLNALGTATSDIAEMALREISATVRNLQIAEKKQIHTFAENPKVQYPNNTKNISNSERSLDNGNHIQQERRLQHSQSDSTAGSTGNSPWEIRIETKSVSQTEPQSAVHQSSDIGQAERASHGNRAGGNEPNGTDSITDGEIAGRDRTDESNRPNEVGRLSSEKILTPRAYVAEQYGKYKDCFHPKYPTDWNHGTIVTILQNREYLGHFVGNKSTTKSFKNRKIVRNPKEEWIEIPNTHQPIVEQYIFDMAQKAVRTKQRDDTKEPNMFAGLLRCSDCGRALGYVKGKTEGHQGAYNCNLYRQKATRYCTAHYITHKVLYQLVLDDIRRNAQLAKQYEDELSEYAQKIASGNANVKYKHLQKELDKHKQRKGELYIIIKVLRDGSEDEKTVGTDKTSGEKVEESRLATIDDIKIDIMRRFGIYDFQQLGRITIRQYHMMTKSIGLRQLDELQDLHLQAWLNQQVKGTRKHGKKYEPVYKNFNAFFNYKKLEDEAAGKSEKQGLNDLGALMLKANSQKGGG